MQIAAGQSFAPSVLTSGKLCANNCSIYLVSLPGPGSSAVYRVAEQLSSSSIFVFEPCWDPHGQRGGDVGGVGSPAVPQRDERPTAAAALCRAGHPHCSWLWVSESF